MRKLIVWLISTIVLLLLVACGPEGKVEPTKIPEQFPTPTVAPTATCTPSLSLGPSATPILTLAPSITPTTVPTRVLQETVAPEKTPSATPSPTPSATPSPLPSATPSPIPSPTPSATPSPTPSPLPSATPSPLPSPTPIAVPSVTPSPLPSATPSPTPSPSPSPTVNPEPLVAHGWQKAVSIDEAYSIVFPDLFRTSELSKTDRELLLTYTCEENPDIQFMIHYVMQQTLEEAQEEILLAEGMITEQLPEEHRISYLLHKENVVYQGVLLEAQYSKLLLGESFGDGEWVTGILNVVFACPAEHSMEYQTKQYSFYVVKNGEEN